LRPNDEEGPRGHHVSRQQTTRRGTTMLQRLQAIREREDGFTLIELLIVIVVFGVRGINDTSKTSACKSDLKSVEIASEAYYANKSPHAYATAIDDAT